VKVAVVVQRYGGEINGGAELHARYVAEHLARHVQVEVLTTCAVDYLHWKNALPAGTSEVNGIPVRRFRVRRERDLPRFGKLSARVFHQPHTLADELAWLDAEGPLSPSLITYVERHATEYDVLIVFSYRYYQAYHAMRAARGRAVLVPTAERDAAIGLAIFPPVFRGARGIMYNSPEERAMIQAVSGNHQVPSVVVGVGSEVPAKPQPDRFRQKFKLHEPFAIYVGRIDENKGCQELFELFTKYVKSGAGRLSLALVGQAVMPVPDHPRIRHLGRLDDEDKFDAMAAADLLIMPSRYESLSMVTLEAWALGRPVLVNGACDVLKGQAIRSDAGLYYHDASEFIEALRAVERNPWVSSMLGRNGRRFFRQHYEWPIVERKYLDMFERTKESPSRHLEPLPGWFERRRSICPPAAEVVAGLPSGPAVGDRGSVDRAARA
jgi:glycosyltransferase involved in cell wall biosynthesis